MRRRRLRVEDPYWVYWAEDKRRTYQDTDEARPSVERRKRFSVAVLFRSTAIRRQLHNIAADELESVFFSGTRGLECHRRRDEQRVRNKFESRLDGRPRDHGQRQC